MLISLKQLSSNFGRVKWLREISSRIPRSEERGAGMVPEGPSEDTSLELQGSQCVR